MLVGLLTAGAVLGRFKVWEEDEMLLLLLLGG
jgi:hypothetical protein